ncbi:hypothetical protein F5Y17DRAFT_457383 [Xylariaceae sp. FL0594]|nr:hypothetical protein F5Y17DRAFT_457383 [Xylariaceae sp. FL0594]
MPQGHVIWRNPVTFIAMLVKQCGYTSESRRKGLDHQILSAEFLTHSTGWHDPNIEVVKWPRNLYEAIRLLYLSYNDLILLNHTVRFEIDSWKRIRMLLDGQKTEAMAGSTSTAAAASEMNARVELMMSSLR